MWPNKAEVPTCNVTIRRPIRPTRATSGAEDARRFGQMVRARRKAQGLRQEDVASATGVGRRYIVDMENGKPTLRIGPALRIARYLGIVPTVHASASTVPGDDLPDGIVDDAAGLPPLED